jgi:class 3 adenylate cyclase
MDDLILIKDIKELLGGNLTFPEIEEMGRYFIKGFSCHTFMNVNEAVSISPQRAAAMLVDACIERKKTKELLSFTIELDNTPLNGKKVKLEGLENLLFRLYRSGIYYNFDKRKLVSINTDKDTLTNWGALKDGKEYPIIIASIDLCHNSELVEKYGTKVMEKIYYLLWNYLQHKLKFYNGRIWSWAGDGGLLAFRDEGDVTPALQCCLEILFSLPIFNRRPRRPIKNNISIRLALDCGNIKFFSDTGKIVSNIINYAAHLEKKATHPNGISVSENIFSRLDVKMKKIFKRKSSFEGKTAYKVAYRFDKALF